MVLLAAISYQRIGYGLVLVTAFSLGLASTLTAVGLAFVFARQLITPRARFGTIARVLPVFSALVIACAGVAIFYSALGEAGFHFSDLVSQITARAN
jgi:ABC-type nickel/cobalt efflux system permease component RcnA